MTASPGFVLAAPNSGTGKTSVAAGLCAALRATGRRIRAFKVGPDYLDPTYLACATGETAYNLDEVLVSPEYVAARYALSSEGRDLAVVEGVMGLYDGGPGGVGSTARVASLLGLPVVLVVDARAGAQTVAAVAHGMASFPGAPAVAGVLANRVAGEDHRESIREALARVGLPLLGALPRLEGSFPSRHLGLIPAEEAAAREGIGCLAAALRAGCDLEALARAARPPRFSGALPPLPEPLGRPVRLAVARDPAASFFYPDQIELFRRLGAEVRFFSPLADGALPEGTEAVYLPGGYPEEHAAALSENRGMLDALRGAAAAGIPIFAECGGLMLLSRGVGEREGGRTFPLAGLLDLDCRMGDRLARFGYVEVLARRDSLLFRRGETARGHEFHYSSASGEEPTALEVRRLGRPGPEWKEGYERPGLLATYVHFNLWGFPEAAARLLRTAAKKPLAEPGPDSRETRDGADRRDRNRAARVSGGGPLSFEAGSSEAGPKEGRETRSLRPVPFRRPARCLMVCGTTSDAGKSFLVTGLCRLFARRGIRVAPFKSQNMALNAYVASDGGEMGVAQALQAEAAGLEPDVRFNPVLLKPQGDSVSQVIHRGRAVGIASASEYHGSRWREAWEVARGALAELRDEYDLILIEGAGSPAEMNLYEADMANLRVAREAGAPVLLVADVERGGAIASLLGTLWVLPPEDGALIAGFVVNRFRGDLRLFDGAVRYLEERGGRPVLGVLPHDPTLNLPAEDSLNLRDFGDGPIRIAVVSLPRISNFTDFDAFADDGCRVVFARTGADLAGADLIVLPGSKMTGADLRVLRERGLEEPIRSAAAAGTPVWGICGGYQMLGERIADPEGFEERLDVPGLGLLPVETLFGAEKVALPARARVEEARGFWSFLRGRTLSGYEIHSGRSLLRAGEPLLSIRERAGRPLPEGAGCPDGALDGSGTVMGCHLHGLADDPAFRRPLVDALRGRRGLPPLASPARTGREIRSALYDRMADLLEERLDRERLDRIALGGDRSAGTGAGATAGRRSQSDV